MDDPISEYVKIMFSYTDTWGNTTKVEKEFRESWNISPFDTLLTELAQCLKATGFGEKSIDESILYPR